MAQLSDDCFAFGGQLMTGAAALDLLYSKTVALPETEVVPLDDAFGRFLAADMVAPRAVPPHDNSAVDGYAVFHADLLADRDTVLPVGGRAAAGHPLGRPAQRGEAIRIFTGAQMPEGPDTVMMQEDCVVHDGAVHLRPGLKKGANRRRAGEDVTAGAIVIPAGRRLRAQELGLAAALGFSEISVYRRLRVAIFSTGDELAEPGWPCPRAGSMTPTATPSRRCSGGSAAPSPISASSPTVRQRSATRSRQRRRPMIW
jgi:molybdopterin molybdotransferase